MNELMVLPEQQIRVVGYRRLSLQRDVFDKIVRSGGTLQEYLEQIWEPLEGINVRVTVNGELIDRAEWGTFKPKGGQIITARMIPTGGDGGSKDIIRLVAMVAVVVVAIVAQQYWALPLAGALGVTEATAGALIMATVSVTGSLLVNALIPPSRPRLNDLSGLMNSSPQMSLTGTQNQFAPYASIPRVYGMARIYPPHASRPFTEVVGQDQYLRVIFCLGYGPVTISDMRIGETPLDQFSDVLMDIRQGFASDLPITLFPDNITEEALSILLPPDTFVTRTSQPNAKEVSVDITFPQGLVMLHQRLGALQIRVDVSVEYRKVGDVTWVALPDIDQIATVITTVTGANNDLVFAAKSSGHWGNNISVFYIPSTALSVAAETGVDPETGLATGSYFVYVYYNPSVTTAAQIKTAMEANTFVASILNISNAPANTGAGTIPTVDPYFQWTLSGGIDQVNAFSVSSFETKQIRRSVRFPLPEEAQYEIRLKKIGGHYPSPFGDVFPDTEATFFRDVYWTAFRTIHTSAPLSKPGMAYVALRMRATNQLNGTIDRFNCICSSILKDWDSATQTWVLRPTSNPASIYRNVMQGSANRRPKTDAQMDLPTIQAFHEKCDQEGFEFNAVIDFKTTVKQLRQDVLATGRGAFHLRDMKYSVLYETPQDIGVAAITPRNSYNFTWTKKFIEIPHAIRVRYIDRDSDYRQNLTTVYADGFSASNASIFQDTDAGLGVVHQYQVQKLKKRELAEAKLRPDDYTVMMDFENLQFTRGDRVELTHDAILFGIHSGRITDGVVNGSSLLTQITLDQPVVMESGKEYGVRLWKSAGGQCIGKCTTVVGTQTVLNFPTPIPNSVNVVIGDLFQFGLFGSETVACVVKSIMPDEDFKARVTLVDYAPAIMTADQVPIPPYEGNVTLPAVAQSGLLPPIIDRIQSDEAVLVRQLDGSLESRILLTISFRSGSTVIVQNVSAQFRPQNATDAIWLQIDRAVDGSGTEISLTPVVDGQTYDVRVRTEGANGEISSWTEVFGHTVIGKTSPPPDVEVLVIEGDRLRWNYELAPPDLAGFVVRYRSGIEHIWESATPAHDDVLTTTDFQIFRNPGIWTFLVKAQDTSRNQSQNAAAVTINLGDVLLENVIVTQDEKALGFPGTITNGTINGGTGDLEADSSTPYWPSDDNAIFWDPIDANLFWSSTYLEMTYLFTVTPDEGILDATMKLDYTIDGVFSIFYRSDSSAPMWGEDDSALFWGNDSDPMWGEKGPFTQWPGSLPNLSHQEYEFAIVTQAGLEQGVISGLELIFDVPDINEPLNDVAIDSAGTRLPITQSFRQILRVRIDLQDDGGTAISAKIIDKDVTLGPMIKCYDATNTPVDGLVDAVVQGY